MGHGINESDQAAQVKVEPWHRVGKVGSPPTLVVEPGESLPRLDSPMEGKAAEIRQKFRQMEVTATVGFLWMEACAEVSGIEPSRMSDDQRKQAYVLASQKLGELTNTAAYHDHVEGIHQDPIVDQMWGHLQDLMAPTPIPEQPDRAQSVPVS